MYKQILIGLLVSFLVALALPSVEHYQNVEYGVALFINGFFAVFVGMIASFTIFSVKAFIEGQQKS